MKTFLRTNRYQLLFIFFLLAFFILGVTLKVFQQTDEYYELAFYSEKLLYLSHGDWKQFFFTSVFSYENSLFYNLLLMIFRSHLPSFINVFGILVDILLFLTLSLFPIFKKNKTIWFLVIYFIGIYDLALNDLYAFFIETKLTILMYSLLYLFYRKNSKFTLAYEIFLTIFFFSVFLVFVFAYHLIFSKERKQYILFGSLLGLYLLAFVFWIHPTFQMNVDWIKTCFVPVFDYHPIGLPSLLYWHLFNLVFFLVFILSLVFIFCYHPKKYSLGFVIFFIALIGYASTTNARPETAVLLKHYFLAFFLMMMYLTEEQYLQTEKMNLFNDRKLHFSLMRLFFPFVCCLFVLGFSSVSVQSESPDSFMYKIKYDSEYNVDTHRVEHNPFGLEFGDYKQKLESFGISLDYCLEEHMEYGSFKNEDIFVYGFGKAEDSNGSRWTENDSAVNMFGRRGDSLLVSLYMPLDQAPFEFKILVDNCEVYQGITKDGSQNIIVPLDITDGNHIIKFDCVDIKESSYCLYVTNIVLANPAFLG